MNALKNPSLVLLLSLALFAGCHNMGSNLDEFNQPVYTPGYATGFDIRKADGKESTLISVTDPWQGADSVSTWLYVARNGEDVPEGFTGQVLAGEARRIVALSSTHIAMLDAINPDVFGVQEAYDFQLSYIEENCPRYKAVGVGRDDGSNEGEHMSVIYNTEKIEMLDWGTYWLSETPDVPSFGWDAACRRTATWTKLRVIATGKEFFFVNTHLDHVGVVARKEGLAMIVKRIGDMNPDGVPMILTGDFNITPDNEGLVDLAKIMKNSRYEAVTSDTKPSYNGWGAEGAASEIDYIYYDGFRDCSWFKVLDKQYVGVPYISDHYPVVAHITF